MTAAKTVSIVLASYNGIKFIGEQLDSILAQTRLPDEVIISDDCSTDGTYEFCRDYILEHKLKGWHVFRNESNLGHRKNFRQALLKCTGDYVFTCDQDDIWLPEKIQIMTQVLDSNPEINLLVSNLFPLYEGKKGKLHLKYINYDNGFVVQLKLKDFWLMNQRPGCTFCLRRELLDKFSVMDCNDDFHDEMLWRFAITSDSLYLLNRKLIYWRRHSENATVASRTKDQYLNISQKIQRFIHKMNVYQKFIDKAEALGISQENQKLLREEKDFLIRRIKIFKKQSLFLLLLFAIMNFKNYPTLRQMLSDIYAMIFLRT